MNDLPTLVTMDFIGPVIAGIIFICIMSKVPEPARQNFNAILVAGAAAAYLNSGFGPWEYLYAALATWPAYKGLSDYRYIGIAWLMHSGWDILHHLYATPIWPWMPTSSLGCMIFDAVIAIWFLYSAPNIFTKQKKINTAQ